MSFSVIINTYNYGKFIEQAIDGVLNQTFPSDKIEIIVVDDGSTDDTPRRVEKYGDRIRYVRKENGGQASALNAGFALAKGDIVALLDSDDYWYPDKLERIFRVYERENAGAVFHNLDMVTSAGKSGTIFPDESVTLLESAGDGAFRASMKYLEETSRAFYYLRFLAPTSGHSYRKSIAEKIFPIPPEYVRNADFFLHAMAFTLTDIHYIHTPLGAYRKHEGSWTRSSAQDFKSFELNLAMVESLAAHLRSVERSARAETLAGILQNQFYLNSFLLDKNKGKPIGALKHLRRYTAHDAWMPNALKKTGLLFFLVTPRWLWNVSRKALVEPWRAYQAKRRA